MRHLILIPFLLGIAFSPLPVRAQNGADIMRGIIGFAAGEIDRQQRRERQQRIHRRRHQQFTTAWQACFRDDLSACNQALTYQFINATDRTRLEDKRRAILVAREESIERARRDDIERRRAEREQTAEAQRQERIREQEERRLADLRASRQRQAEFERQRVERAQAERRLVEQRVEAERLQSLREQEERRLADLRAYGQTRNACRDHDVSACARALQSSLASTEDLTELRRWQTEAETYQQNRDTCKAGERSACTIALASPALIATDRNLLERWHADAHPFNRAMAFTTELPTSTVVTGSLALCLSFVLGMIAFRRRVPVQATAPEDAEQSDDQPNAPPPKETLRQRLSKFIDTCRQTVSGWKQSPNSETSNPSSEPPLAEEAVTNLMPPPLRDTPGALAALELAEAYIEEVREAERPNFDDKITRRAQLNTLTLAAKQLALAEECDPDAELVISDDKGDVSFTIGALKAKALILEARVYDDHDTKHALPPLRQAIQVDPANAMVHYLLGMIEATNMNRVRAIEALQTAVELEPDNLTFRKELNRAESISGAEAATFKATRIGERAYDTGIAAWNIFAVTWNILTFPFRMISAVVRIFKVG